MKSILILFLFIYSASSRPDEDPVQAKEASGGAPEGDVILQRITMSVKRGTANFWWEARNSLLYCDAYNASCYLWNYGNGKVTPVHFNLEELIAFKIPLKGNSTGAILGSDNNIRLVNVKNDGSNTLSEVKAQIPDKGYFFSKGHCDSKGNLFALANKDANLEAKGRMYKITVAGGIEKIHEFTGPVSDFAFDPKTNKKMYATTGKKVFSYDFDIDKGTLSNEELFFEPAYPCVREITGVEVDLQNDVFVTAVASPGRVFKINPKTKKRVKTIVFPHREPTQLTFGGWKNKNLIVGFQKSRDNCDDQSGSNMLVGGLTSVSIADNLCNYK